MNKHLLVLFKYHKNILKQKIFKSYLYDLMRLPLGQQDKYWSSDFEEALKKADFFFFPEETEQSMECIKSYKEYSILTGSVLDDSGSF